MPDRPAQVTRCVCLDVTFARLKRLHDDEGLDFTGLQKRTRCSTGCGLCEPYIRLMLETGATAFPVLTDREVSTVMRKSSGS